MAADDDRFRPKWLSNGVFEPAALLEARQKCRPLGLTPALLNQNMDFNKIQETCITLKLEKQWVSIWVC